jgi:hypothetical protein
VRIRIQEAGDWEGAEPEGLGDLFLDYPDEAGRGGAPAGGELAVSMSLDASWVLTVTARDAACGIEALRRFPG